MFRSRSQTQRQPLAKSTLGIFGIMTISLVAWCVAQQSEPKNDALRLPSPSLQLPSVPSLESPQPIVNDPKSDPLFQEIQRMILRGNTDRLAPPSTLSVENKSSLNASEESVSSARWHAVESILAAARMLEEDAASSLRRNDLEQASKTGNAIRALRGQALDLLRLQ
ncbi:MAG: hypothetical protein NTU79_16415 [Planctomycetota bacterium]|nr:hypothetical protein [Planctomycetota bacterium]